MNSILKLTVPDVTQFEIFVLNIIQLLFKEFGWRQLSFHQNLVPSDTDHMIQCISLHISHSFTGWWYCDEFFNFTLVLPAQQILIIYPLLWIFTLGGFMPLIKYYLWTMKNYSFKFLKWILHNSEKMQNSYSPII